MVTITINEIEHAIEAEEGMPLLSVIRDMLGMTGTKYADRGSTFDAV